MTVSTTTNRKDYIGDGRVDTFPFDFKIFAKTDLQVYVDEILKRADTDYSVTGVGSETGGNVIFAPEAVPALSVPVLIIRNVPIVQETDWVDHGPDPAGSIEDAADRLTMIAQQFMEYLDRILKVPVTSTVKALEIPVVAGGIPRWNSAGDNFDCISLTPGDTVNVITSKGDLIVGGTAGIAERLCIGAIDQLPTVTAGNQLAYKTGTAERLTNRSAMALSQGHVVIIDSGNDEAVTTSTTEGQVTEVLVADEPIAIGATGRFRHSGKMTVLVQGNVSRGDTLYLSTTAGRAKSAGASLVGGVFAQALTAYSGNGAGSVTAFVFGRTYKAAISPVTFLNPPVNLINWNAATDWTDVDISSHVAAGETPIAAIVQAELYSYQYSAGNGCALTGLARMKGSTETAVLPRIKIKIAAMSASGPGYWIVFNEEVATETLTVPVNASNIFQAKLQVDSGTPWNPYFKLDLVGYQKKIPL